MRKRDDIDHSERNLGLRHFGYMALPWVWLVPIGAEWISGDQHSIVYRLTSLLEMILLIGTSAVSIWHSRDLCVKCMAGVPLNGQKRAESGMWRLKLHHLDWKFFGVIVILTLIMDVILDPTENAPKIVWSGLDLVFAVLSFNSIRHNKLAFWCPWCKDDGDGNDEQVPDPQDNKDRPIPA